MTNIMGELGHNVCYHITPLHYLPYIARETKLLSKLGLRTRGFAETHFRSTSRKADQERGFAGVVHTTLWKCPPILQAKLRLGLPHVVLTIPIAGFPEASYALCRYNIAKNRDRFTESQVDGHLYPSFTIPLAQTDQEKRGMLSTYARSRCLEVLFFDHVDLSIDVSVTAFCDADASTAQQVLRSVGSNWMITEEVAPVAYARQTAYQSVAAEFISRVLREPTWTGFAIEFDR